MRICLYSHPTLTPDRPRVGLLRTGDVVDANAACATSLTGHMSLRRAVEIADALCPPDLLSFLEGGKHAWNALRDSLARLGPRLDEAPLTSPTGDAVVVPESDVVLAPLVPAGAGWKTAVGQWGTTPVPSPGSDVVVMLHSDGGAYLPEAFALIGSPVDGPVDAASALDAVALVAVVRPSHPETASVLMPVADADDEEPGLAAALAKAVASASHDHALLAGDVIRCGPPVVSRPRLDLRLRTDGAARALAADIVRS